MKYLFLILCLSYAIVLEAQVEKEAENVIITLENKKNHVISGNNGALHVNVKPKDLSKFKMLGYVSYSDFGAVSDGKTDAMNAIAATHAFANQHGLKVKADEAATYYISGKERSAIIQTDTDFGTASFIIDDTNVINRKTSIFIISSSFKAFKLNGIEALKRNQKKINVSLPNSCLVTVNNSKVKHYIRYGLNQNNGSDQTDIFIVDKSGNVDMDAPIIWDFDEITEIIALPMDTETLNISGGKFTTIANKSESKYSYYARNFLIKRSNVQIDQLEHRIIGEADHGAPYHGFITTRDCANITIKNSVLTGHKTYQTIGAAGKQVSMGSYDISLNRTLNVAFINCKQTNDINDKKFWGVFSSNYSKNLSLDNCTFSRFDAHKGVANASIRNSTLGHMGINAIGSGMLTVENTTINARNFINLRSDYGSTWQGEVQIRNCIFIPLISKSSNASLFNGYNSGMHNFGYICYMPELITIENLKIDDTNYPEDKSIDVFADFNKELTDETFIEDYPYIKSKKVILKNVNTTSGKPLEISGNTYMFKDVKVSIE